MTHIVVDWPPFFGQTRSGEKYQREYPLARHKMMGNNVKRQYHPAFRALSWGVPLAALAIIAAFMIFGEDSERGTGIEVAPPASAGIPYIGFARIDSVIAGATKAFEKKNYEEAARLLTRARFFIHSGISDGRFDGVRRNLDLILGLSEFYRGYPVKGILFVTYAAETEPQNETYAWYLGMMHLSRGDKKEAKPWLEKTAAIGGIYSESAKTALEAM